VALGGAAERYGVLPDLATYGKAMAGGWPVSAVAGRLELMERFGNASVNHSGTFNAYLPGAAATVSAIELLKRKGTYERVSDIGSMLIEGLRDAGARHGVPLRVQGPPMAFHVSFGDFAAAEDFASLGRSDVARYRAFTELLVQKGVWVTARGIWYVSTAHSEADVEETLSCVESALVELTA
jgi:glutamate-1-semialdehyde 2,1-aminomutase